VLAVGGDLDNFSAEAEEVLATGAADVSVGGFSVKVEVGRSAGGSSDLVIAVGAAGGAADVS